MLINLKEKTKKIPRNEKGDPAFTVLGNFAFETEEELKGQVGVLQVFSVAEIVELVNRALYQLEYQKEAHRKRGMKQREVDRRLKEELKSKGVDPKAQEIHDQLKGKK